LIQKKKANEEEIKKKEAEIQAKKTELAKAQEGLKAATQAVSLANSAVTLTEEKIGELDKQIGALKAKAQDSKENSENINEMKKTNAARKESLTKLLTQLNLDLQPYIAGEETIFKTAQTAITGPIDQDSDEAGKKLYVFS
jgi:chromosome segregation ATPase